MAQQAKSYKKFIATAATATLVASAIVPVASANVTTSAFTDVPNSYKDAIDFVVTNNISKGLTETQYGISQQIKRGDAAIMIAAAAGLVDKDAPSSGFTDVPTRAAISINSLKAAGVVSGKSAKNFGFADNITRGEAALMLQKAFDLKAGTTSNDFTDVSNRYDAAVDALVANEVTKGINKTQFGTQNNIKRGDFAKFVYALEDEINVYKLDVESLTANSTTEFAVMLKEALPEGADLTELLKVKVVLKDGTVVTPEATDVKVSTDRKTITVEHKDNDLDGLAGTLTVNGKNLEFNYVAEEAGTLTVESVMAITSTGVTVTIDAPTEDLVDAEVVVKDTAGKVYATKKMNIKAGATEATFAFETPLTVSPTEGWTVNGVKYVVADMAIVQVERLTDNGKYLEVLFNKPLTSLEVSELAIRNADTLERVGVQKVELASNGLSAQITLLGSEDAEADEIIASRQDYILSITKDGKLTSKVFNLDQVRPNQVVTNTDAKEGTVNGLKLAEGVTVDFEEILGRTATYWVNKDGLITRINLKEEKVVNDAINFVIENGKVYAETLTEGKKYLVSTNQVLVKNSNGGVTPTAVSINPSDYDYESAKLVFNNRGEVSSIVAVPSFGSSILVKENKNSIITGYGDELNLESYTITKDGRTMKASEIKEGDVVFFNNTLKVAEVYNAVVNGKIEGSYDNAFKINGKNYDHDGRYVKDGKLVNVDSNGIDALKASDKAVQVYLNRAGEVSVITGDLGEVATSEVVSYLTDGATPYELKGKQHITLATLSAAGTAKDYDVLLEGLESIHSVANNGTVTEYNVGDKTGTGTGTTTRIKEFKLASGFNAAAGTFTLEVIEETTNDSTGAVVTLEAGTAASKTWTQADFAKGNALEVIQDADGEVVGLMTAAKDTLTANINVAEGDKVASLTTLLKDVQLKNSTPVFYKQGNKVVSTTYGALDKNVVEEITAADVYTDGSDALYVVVNTYTGPAAFSEFETVISAINAKSGDIAYLEVMVDGVSKEYPVKAGQAIGNLKVGAIVDVEVNKTTGAIDKITADATGADTAASGVVNGVSITNKKFNLDATPYRIADSGVKVYEMVDGKVEARDFRDLASLKGDNTATISTIGATNVVDTIVITRNKDIVFTSSTNVTAADVATLGLTGTTATSGNTGIVTASIVGGNVEVKSVGVGTTNVTVKDSSNNTATMNVTVSPYGAITVNSITKYVAPITALSAETFAATTGNTTVTITLADGKFASGVTIGDFTFAGDNNTLTSTGSLVRTSDTVVTITTSSLTTATNDTVVVKASALAEQATDATVTAQ